MGLKIDVPIKFKYKKDTKNCYRFEEVTEDNPEVIGALYVKKWVFNGTPKGLVVELKEEGGE